MGEIISVVSLKGGCGKSTICINTAGALCKQHKFLLKDVDPQETIKDWHRARIENNIINNNLFIESGTLADIKKQALKYEFTFIDTPPEDDQLMRSALVVSSYCIIPITPSPYDMRSAFKTIKTITEGRRAGIINVKPYILISRKVKNTNLGMGIREALEVFKLPICKTEISNRIVLAEAGISGKTIQEYEPASQSAKEFNQLAKEIEKW